MKPGGKFKATMRTATISLLNKDGSVFYRAKEQAPGAGLSEKQLEEAGGKIAEYLDNTEGGDKK